MKKIDSRIATMQHKFRIAELLSETVVPEVLRRANAHDNSKLATPEKEMFDEVTERLAGLTYGSDEYNESLKYLKPALDHHYAKNSHHPEHYKDGINGMNLFDLVEMFFDWKAASERHNDGNINKSIEINGKRFNMSPQLIEIYENTAKMLKY